MFFRMLKCCLSSLVTELKEVYFYEMNETDAFSLLNSSLDFLDSVARLDNQRFNIPIKLDLYSW